MPLRFQMGDLRTRTKRRAGMEGDKSVQDPEWNSLISEMYGEVYEVGAAPGLRYFEYSLQITTAGLAYLSEPADHLSMVDTIERVVNATTGERQRLMPIQAQQRARWSGRTGHARRWDFVDDRINLYPTPPSGDVYELRYVPQPPDLTNYGDTDVVDVITTGGLAALIWGAALVGMSKDKSNVELAMTQRDRGLARLADWATNRLATMPMVTYIEDDEDLRDDADWRYRR